MAMHVKDSRTRLPQRSNIMQCVHALLHAQDDFCMPCVNRCSRISCTRLNCRAGQEGAQRLREEMHNVQRSAEGPQ